MRDTFPINLKELLKERGITQAELATAIGVSKGTMSDWLSGRFFPRPKYIEAIAEYFNVDAADLQRNKKSSPPSIDDELLRLYKALSAEKQDQVKDYIKYLVQQRQE